MKKGRRPAELHNAYMWDCDHCGKENYVRAVIVEITPDDAEEYVEDYGGDAKDWRTGRWEDMPDVVVCRKCKTQFDVSEPLNDDDDDESE